MPPVDTFYCVLFHFIYYYILHFVPFITKLYEKQRLFNLLETVKHSKYIGHRLQGILYKIQQDDMFPSDHHQVRKSYSM